MDSIVVLHSLLEVAAALCLFYISFINIEYRASGKYSDIVGWGFGIAATMDILRAILSTYPTFAEFWCPTTWAMSRFVLLQTYISVAFCYTSLQCVPRNVFSLLLVTPTLFVAVTIFQYFELIDLSFVHTTINIAEITIYRPLDFILLIGWIAMSFLLYEKRSILFPPTIYGWFMVLGAAVHFIMAFLASYYIDTLTLIAHALKLAEYYTFILIYLIYHHRAMSYHKQLMKMKSLLQD